MIAMQNIIDNDKSLLTIIFSNEILKHLKCKCDDYLVVLQSKFKPSLFLLVKSDNGYRIRRFPRLKKTYQISVSYRFDYVPEFDFKECIYFLKQNNTVRINIK